jgi:acetyl-CoA carboxylase biotin carboxyl carrier protein
LAKKRKPIMDQGLGATSSARDDAADVGAGPMNIRLLSEITRLMKENDLNTVDVRDGSARIVLRRGLGGQIQTTGLPSSVGTAVRPHDPAPVTPSTPATPSALSDTDANLVPINSPMVGTVYLKPSPDAKQSYVATGSKVGTETVVCLIEAMKVFNEIKAETNGTIARILVSDGQTVEFGQPLFMVSAG